MDTSTPAQCLVQCSDFCSDDLAESGWTVESRGCSVFAVMSDGKKSSLVNMCVLITTRPLEHQAMGASRTCLPVRSCSFHARHQTKRMI